MKLAHTFMRGFVWKIAALLAVALFSWLGMSGNAHAQAESTVCNAATNPLCDQGKAYNEALRYANAYTCMSGGINQGDATAKVKPGDAQRFDGAAHCFRASDSFHFYPLVINTYWGPGKTCATRPNTIWNITAGIYGCLAGCDASCSATETGETICFFGEGTCDTNAPPNCLPGDTLLPSGMCQPGDKPVCTVDEMLIGDKCIPKTPCPEGQKRGADGKCQVKPATCTAPQIKGPDGQCIDPEKSCPRGQSTNSSGTCAPGGEDDANDDDHEASGGDICNAPPMCSGDAILCLQTKIQWRIDCNTRKNRTVTGGACNAMPVCTGEKCDALEYSSLILQWRATCAAERALASNGGPVTGPAGQPDWTKVTGDGSGGGEDPDKPHRTVGLGISVLDQSGFFGGSRDCPTLGVINAGMFGTFDLDAQPWMCQFVTLVNVFFKLMGAFIAFGILAGRNND